MGNEAISLSDRDLERRVKGFLKHQHFASLRKIEVNSQSGVVTISGRVNSFHERQLCINCCQRVAGILGLNDRIEVGRDHKTSRPSLGVLHVGRPALAG
jgi:osmotically-inducible protein OsmY